MAWKVALGVFVSIICIEVVILVPSYRHYKDQLYAQLELSGNVAVTAAVTQSETGHQYHDPLFAKQLLTVPGILGVTPTYDDGDIVSFGDGPSVTSMVQGPDNVFRSKDRSGSTYDLGWLLPSKDGQHTHPIFIRMDSSAIVPELTDYVHRVVGLVVIIALFVSTATMIVLWWLVLRPVRSLQETLLRAGADTSAVLSLGKDVHRTDEMGELYRTAQTILDRILASVAEAARAKEELEHKVMDRTRGLQKLNSRLEKQVEETRLAEERSRSFAMTAADWYWEMDKDLRFSYFSDQFFDITGVEREFLIGRTREETGIPNIEEDAWERHLSDLHARRPFREFVHPRTKTDGSIVWLSINGHPLFDTDNKFRGYLGTGNDVTAMKDVEETLCAAKIQAELANKAKSEFLASMSHEIRTPMTGVIGFADMLLKDELTDESREKIFRIKDSTNSLLTLLNEILDMSKMEAGKMDMEIIDFHLPSLIEDASNLFIQDSRDRDRKNVDLTVVVDDNLPSAVRSDPTRLRQVLVNLIGNAVKFTEHGRVDVHVSLETSDQDGGTIRFVVQDTGIGISPDNIVKLFTNFSQADASITRRYQGSGLGLAICKRIIDHLGGSIGVESEIGKGSTFWFTLPYVAAETDVQPARWKSTVTEHQTTRALRILVAEDNRVNQRIIRSIVQSYGHSLTIVEDGVQVVEMHQADTFDLILMDIRMPEMSGTDAARMIRQLDGDKGDIPIIALTADAMNEHKVEYIDAGMNAVVAKPISHSELLEAINASMGEEIHVASAHSSPQPLQPNHEPVSEDTKANVAEFLSQLKSVGSDVG